VILVVVALGITVLVYGVVGLIVKMDDFGLRLAERPGRSAARLGRALVLAMPRLLTVLTLVGTAAMLWVGGHILLVGSDELGLHVVYDAVHSGEEVAKDGLGAVGSVAAWLVNTVASALIGLVVGAVVVALLAVTLHRRERATH
jgi:predicted DNA repair protein MutK